MPMLDAQIHLHSGIKSANSDQQEKLSKCRACMWQRVHCKPHENSSSFAQNGWMVHWVLYVRKIHEPHVLAMITVAQAFSLQAEMQYAYFHCVCVCSRYKVLQCSHLFRLFLRAIECLIPTTKAKRFSLLFVGCCHRCCCWCCRCCRRHQCRCHTQKCSLSFASWHWKMQLNKLCATL